MRVTEYVTSNGVQRNFLTGSVVLKPDIKDLPVKLPALIKYQSIAGSSSRLRPFCGRLNSFLVRTASAVAFRRPAKQERCLVCRR